MVRFGRRAPSPSPCPRLHAVCSPTRTEPTLSLAKQRLRSPTFIPPALTANLREGAEPEA